MSGRRHRLLLGMFLLVLFPLAWFLHPYVMAEGFTVCFFHTITGESCFFCGLTRALASAMHGDFQVAFGYHALWWLAALVMAGLGLLALVDGLTASNHIGTLRQRTAFADKYIVTFLVLFALYQVLN